MNFLKNFIFFSLIYGLGVNARDRDWWKHTTIYEVYIWSFVDSNGDGIGDIKGITSKLDHFVDLGKETLWISPFFQSPMKDMGYDVSNFTSVDPLFGTMADFDELMEEMNKRGLQLMADFAINHSSDEHLWFEKSVARVDPYTDYYVWKDPKGYDKNGHPIPPNNWISIFSGSAWKWNDKRQQFYYHQFSEKQPDLNLRNSALKAELKSIMKFWFDKGVAAARLDAVRHYIEDLQLRDEPLINPNDSPGIWDNYNHIYTVDLWESYEFIHEFREFIDNYSSTSNREIVSISEAYASLNDTMAYYGTPEYKVAHFPFNFNFVKLDTFPTPKHFDGLIKTWLDNIPPHGVPNWVSENHDNFRTGTRLNNEFVDIMVMTTLTLPGVACLYYGQEIGMVDYQVRLDQIRDPNNDGHNLLVTRDPERLPMQWDDTMNAGFSSNPKPWLPVNPDYWRVNVESQKKDPRSRYNTYKIISKLRKTRTLEHGNFKSYFISAWVYAFTRSITGEPTYITIINLGTETEMVHLHHSIPKLPFVVKVLAASLNAGYRAGDKIRTHPKYPQTFILRPMSSIVVST